ncbi:MULTISPECIES: hypothetical protein [Erythrobacter]|nr:hypothetical protein [Erythrobacter litoralis]MEE4337319.1 hypothetical protein [Erythrobacter sp.]
MTRMALMVLAATFALGACTSAGSRGDLAGARTVFHNPFATMERFEDEMRDGAFLPGSGRFAFDREGNPIRLRREERRAMRDRAAAVRSTIILRDALERGQRVPIPLDAPSRREDAGGTPAIEPSPGAPPIAVPVSLPAPLPPAPIARERR